MNNFEKIIFLVTAPVMVLLAFIPYALGNLFWQLSKAMGMIAVGLLTVAKGTLKGVYIGGWLMDGIDLRDDSRMREKSQNPRPPT